jgi:hypothetical protein
VKLWNTATWRETRTLGEKKTAGLLEQLHPLAFSADGKLIAASFVGFDEKSTICLSPNIGLECENRRKTIHF